MEWHTLSRGHLFGKSRYHRVRIAPNKTEGGYTTPTTFLSVWRGGVWVEVDGTQATGKVDKLKEVAEFLFDTPTEPLTREELLLGSDE